jgi:hypothetical protein
MVNKLRAEKVLPSIETLCQRIDDRFATRGLSKVCHEFHSVALETENHIDWIKKPILWLRVFNTLLIGIVITLIVNALLRFDGGFVGLALVDLIGIIEAGINDIVFLGVGIFFLVSIENRIKRSQALKALNDLRVFAHVIDMHQLTKEPLRVKDSDEAQDTEHSPKRELTAFELTRYLDYCSEMLSLIGKISALYAQAFDDEVVLAAVNEIEALTNSLARKVWQKIMIIHQLHPEMLNINK